MALSALWGSLGKVVIGDKELSSLLVMAIACAAGITRRNLQEGEIRKEKTHFRSIVKAQEKAAGDPSQECRQAGEILSAEDAGAIIILAAIIRRVEIKKRPRAIVTSYTIGIRKMLDGDIFKAQVDLIQRLLNAVDGEGPMIDLAVEILACATVAGPH